MNRADVVVLVLTLLSRKRRHRTGGGEENAAGDEMWATPRSPIYTQPVLAAPVLCRLPRSETAGAAV